MKLGISNRWFKLEEISFLSLSSHQPLVLWFLRHSVFAHIHLRIRGGNSGNPFHRSFRVVSLRIPFILTIPRNTDFSPLFLSLARSSRVCKFLPRESRASAQVIYLESLLGLGVRARQRLLLFDNEHQRDGGL